MPENVASCSGIFVSSVALLLTQITLLHESLHTYILCMLFLHCARLFSLVGQNCWNTFFCLFSSTVSVDPKIGGELRKPFRGRIHAVSSKPAYPTAAKCPSPSGSRISRGLTLGLNSVVATRHLRPSHSSRVLRPSARLLKPSGPPAFLFLLPIHYSKPF